MLKNRLALLLALLAVAAILARSAPCLAQDDVLDAQGLRRLLSGSRGRVAVVNFWASWCGPCRREVPVLQKLHDTMPGDKINLVGISMDFDREMYERFKDKYAPAYPVYLAAPGLMDELAISTIPRTVVYAPGGKLVASHEGPMEYHELLALVQSLLDQDSDGVRQ
ncbi:TlpA family protein disulfide reductase [Desulfocurvus sp. DL9XJH121]